MRVLITLLVAFSLLCLTGCPLLKTGSPNGESCASNAECASRRCDEGTCVQP